MRVVLAVADQHQLACRGPPSRPPWCRSRTPAADTHRAGDVAGVVVGSARGRRSPARRPAAAGEPLGATALRGPSAAAPRRPRLRAAIRLEVGRLGRQPLDQLRRRTRLSASLQHRVVRGARSRWWSECRLAHAGAAAERAAGMRREHLHRRRRAPPAARRLAIQLAGALALSRPPDRGGRRRSRTGCRRSAPPRLGRAGAVDRRRSARVLGPVAGRVQHLQPHLPTAISSPSSNGCAGTRPRPARWIQRGRAGRARPAGRGRTGGRRGCASPPRGRSASRARAASSRYSSMSHRGSTTAPTPASVSAIRYDAQPRSEWSTWRKSTCPEPRCESGGAGAGGTDVRAREPAPRERLDPDRRRRCAARAARSRCRCRCRRGRARGRTPGRRSAGRSGWSTNGPRWYCAAAKCGSATPCLAHSHITRPEQSKPARARPRPTCTARRSAAGPPARPGRASPRRDRRGCASCRP